MRYVVRTVTDAQARIRQCLVDLGNTSWTTVIRERYLIKIKRADVETALGSAWLINNVCSFYLKLLGEASTRDTTGRLPRVWSFTTDLVDTLLSSTPNNTAKFTWGLDIWAWEVVFVPVLVRAHYTLVVFRPRSGELFYLDSLGKYDVQVVAAVASFLDGEHLRRFGVPMPRLVKYSVGTLPRQHNNDDCGFFLISYARCIATRRSMNFTQRDMPAIRCRVIYEVCNLELLDV